MKIKPAAAFRTDLPDDTIENEYDIIRYPGRGVSDAIAEFLRNAGYKVPRPIHLEIDGWAIQFEAKHLRIWLEIRDNGNAPEYTLGTHAGGFFGPFWMRNWKIYADVVRLLDESLKRDPRFHDVLWYEYEDLHTDAPGSTTPFSEES